MSDRVASEVVWRFARLHRRIVSARAVEKAPADGECAVAPEWSGVVSWVVAQCYREGVGKLK